jgi:hypothetical protein
VIEITPGFSVTDAASDPACVATDFSVNGAAVGDAYTNTIGIDEAGTTPGPAGAYTSTVTLQLVDNGLNQDSCESVTVPITVNAS